MSRIIATRFLALAKKECKSKTVSASLSLEPLSDGSYAIQTPYFWAVFYHDGRGPIRAKPGKVLVYFKNPADDPRIPGKKYPVRAADIKRLTAADFYRFLKDPSYGMIVRKSVGPAKGDPFFVRAQAALTREVGNLVRREMTRYVKEEMGEFMNYEGSVGIPL